MIVFYDAQSNGTSPTVTDVLSTASVCAHLNLANRDRFKILLDRQWAQGGISTTATQTYAQSPGPQEFKEYIRLPKAYQNVVFSGTGATAGSIATGGLWILIIGYQTTGNATFFTHSVRVRFLDP